MSTSYPRAYTKFLPFFRSNSIQSRLSTHGSNILPVITVSNCSSESLKKKRHPSQSQVRPMRSAIISHTVVSPVGELLTLASLCPPPRVSLACISDVVTLFPFPNPPMIPKHEYRFPDCWVPRALLSLD